MRVEPAVPGAQTARVAHLCFYDAINVETIDLVEFQEQIDTGNGRLV